MAEGLLRHFGNGQFEALSAGIEHGELRKEAVEVMKEIGIDISGQKSKKVDSFVDGEFDYVVTVCDSAEDACPAILGAKQRLHWSIEDPDKVTGSDDDVLTAFREARDLLKSKIDSELLESTK